MKVNITNKGHQPVPTTAIDKATQIPQEVNLDALPDNLVTTPKDGEQPEVTPAPVVTPANPTEPPADPQNTGDFNYRQKFAESSREAQILASKNKKLTETIEQAASIPEPTDDEMKKAYPDWDSLTDFERKIAKDNLQAKRQFDMVHQAVLATKKVDEWAKKVDDFTADPVNLQKYTALEGREAEFKAFAMKESRRGLEMGELAEWFASVEPKAPVQHRGTLLGRSNGAQPPAQPKALTIEQIAYIRKNEPRKYSQMVKEGKIKINI